MKNVYVIILSLFFFCQNSFSQQEELLIHAYEDSLNKYEQIAYEINNIRLVEYLNECEEFL